MARRDKNRNQRNMLSGEKRPGSLSRLQLLLFNSRVAMVGASESKCIVVCSAMENSLFLPFIFQPGSYVNDDRMNEK